MGETSIQYLFASLGANLFEGERSTGGPPGAASDDDESTYWQSNDDARRGTAWIAFELNRANQMVEVAEGGRPGRAELRALISCVRVG